MTSNGSCSVDHFARGKFAPPSPPYLSGVCFWTARDCPDGQTIFGRDGPVWMNFRVQQHFIIHKMAAREPSRYLTRAIPRAFAPSPRHQAFIGRRNVSDEAPTRRLSDELETASSLTSRVSENTAKSFDPVSRASARKSQLPRSRYVDNSVAQKARLSQPFLKPGGPSVMTSNKSNIRPFLHLLDTNSGLLSMTVALFTLTNPPPPPIPPPVYSSRAHFLSHAPSRPITRQSHPTS